MEEKEHWINFILREFSRHSMSVIFTIIAFLLFWVIPQINDLIVVINQAERDWVAVMIFFSSLSVFAFLISNLGFYFNPPENGGSNNGLNLTQKKPRLFAAPKDNKEIFMDQNISNGKEFKETHEEYIKRLFPKFLGAILILIAAYAVNNTFQKIYNKPIILLGNWGLLIWIGLLFTALHQKLIDGISKWLNKSKWFEFVPVSILIVSFLTIIFLGFFNKGGSEGDMSRLFYSLLLLAVFFLIVSVSYNKHVLKFKKYVGVPLIILLVTGIFIAYVILLFNPQALKQITPISIVMICLVGVFTFFNAIKFLGFRKKIPVLSIFLIGCIALAIWNANNRDFDHYEASTVSTKIHPDDRLNLATYVEEWIEDRKSAIQSSSSQEKFPIIMVSAEGGGSRAGLWSFLVHSYLYERNSDYFKKYLFSMTGASGGSVGNNMFYTQAYQLLEGTTTSKFKYDSLKKQYLYRASSIYDRDYLSTSVASLMGRDLFKSITNLFTFCDRGKLLELEWEEQFNTVFNYKDSNPLGEPYLELMPRKDQYPFIRPLLITNTTHLQTGERAIMSPVKTSDDANNMAVFKDLLGLYPSDTLMIKRSTAMSMNARFPYISPAARITKLGQYGDAGYYNNIGGAVTRRLEKALLKELEKDSTLTDKYEVKHLLITNFVKESETIAYSSQLVAPAGIIWNATFAHPKEMEKTFTNAYNVQSERTEIPDYKDGTFGFLKIKEEKVLPFIPLGRYLSNAAIHSMEARLEKEEVYQRLDSLFSKKSISIP